MYSSLSETATTSRLRKSKRLGHARQQPWQPERCCKRLCCAPCDLCSAACSATSSLSSCCVLLCLCPPTLPRGCLLLLAALLRCAATTPIFAALCLATVLGVGVAATQWSDLPDRVVWHLPPHRSRGQAPLKVVAPRGPRLPLPRAPRHSTPATRRPPLYPALHAHRAASRCASCSASLPLAGSPVGSTRQRQHSPPALVLLTVGDCPLLVVLATNTLLVVQVQLSEGPIGALWLVSPRHSMQGRKTWRFRTRLAAAAPPPTELPVRSLALFHCFADPGSVALSDPRPLSDLALFHCSLSALRALVRAAARAPAPQHGALPRPSHRDGRSRAEPCG